MWTPEGDRLQPGAMLRQSLLLLLGLRTLAGRTLSWAACWAACWAAGMGWKFAMSQSRVPERSRGACRQFCKLGGGMARPRRRGQRTCGDWHSVSANRAAYRTRRGGVQVCVSVARRAMSSIGALERLRAASVPQLPSCDRERLLVACQRQLCRHRHRCGGASEPRACAGIDHWRGRQD